MVSTTKTRSLEEVSKKWVNLTQLNTPSCRVFVVTLDGVILLLAQEEDQYSRNPYDCTGRHPAVWVLMPNDRRYRPEPSH